MQGAFAGGRSGRDFASPRPIKLAASDGEIESESELKTGTRRSGFQFEMPAGPTGSTWVILLAGSAAGVAAGAPCCGAYFDAHLACNCLA
jgi:hypothetical protein